MPNPTLLVMLLVGTLLVARIPVTIAADSVSDNHGVAASGDIRNSTITINISPEQVETLIRASNEALRNTYETQVKELSGQLGVTQDALTKFFQTLREQNVPPEKLLDTLATIVQRFREMRERLVILNPEDLATKARIEKALTALDAGHYDLADDLLSQAEAAEQAAARQAEQLAHDAQAAADRRWLNVAAARAERGELSLTRLNYQAAAAHFQAATEMTPASAPTARGIYRRRWANALTDYGDQQGNNAALAQAITLYRQALTDLPRAQQPLEWAQTLNNLGNAVQTLGELEAGTSRLEEAVDAYQAALEVRTHAHAPLSWAQTQNNLGNALLRLGEREASTARLEAAVNAYRAALEERTRARAPLVWAMTQSNLGAALQALGELEKGTSRLKEAIDAYRAALEEITRARTPLVWAMTQNNLGLALATLGEREKGTSRLKEAIDAYREALVEYTRERVPLNWAAVQNNLGNALLRLGEREAGTATLEEAFTAYRGALEEYTRARAPRDWARAQRGLAKAYRTLGTKAEAACEAICQELREANLGYQCD